MKRKLIRISFALLCISLCVSCHKKEDFVAPVKTTPITTEGFISLVDLMPGGSSLKYDEHLGYYVPFVQEEWEQDLGMCSLFISSQSVSCSFKAVKSSMPESSGWVADEIGHFILKDIGCPYSTTEFIDAECDAVFKMSLSLGENVPYRKVTLSGFKVIFPEWFHADAETGPIGSDMEVTSEETVFTFRLHSVQNPAQFFERACFLCFSLDVSFQAQATVRPEDYIGPAPEMPAELDFRCGFDFDRIDFTSVGLRFDEEYENYFPDYIVCHGILPAFFSGKDADVTLTNPCILIDFINEFPYTTCCMDAVTYYDSQYKRPTVPFSLSESGKYLLMPKDDGIRREGIKNFGVEGMEKMLSSPLNDSFVRFYLKPVTSACGHFVAEKIYRMHATIDVMLPLAFTGNPNTSLKTSPIELDSNKLGTSYGYKHEFSQEIEGDFPFECLITPVFTMEGKEPVYLDSFVLDKSTTKKVVYQFAPTTGSWKATLHYIITPTNGKGEFFTKEHGLTIKNTVFTANVEKIQ